ncbi:ABC transporter ATP-binding protein [Pseudomonas sp. MF6755]|uniref:nickel ABC transporter ATP-binding protein NikE n=1 Tax=Pseudomonas sp. MF6755 TaxID=2797530 RepID=UPI0018E881C2|nr:ABC transporter ATP-binding protein [Pseudomonas sp. MF6755]MBJ2285270.1 ABC transporter ATP-binding protein [Pseudomonas sp. MF6755]
MKPLRVEHLRVQLDSGRDVIAQINFELSAGQILGLVGESGSGKTTLATALLGHVRKGAQLTDGRVIVAGADVLSLHGEALRKARGGLIAYIPQDPAMALNPALRILRQLHETLAAHEPQLSRAARQQRLRETLQQVGLPDDEGFLKRFAHQLSGGQQQRVLLALAFILRPQVVVLDEPTTALDVTTQARFLASLRQLCKSQGVAAVYVSHDLAVVKSLADRVMVLYAGRVVECAETAQLFRQPVHPYSQRLVAAATLAARPSTVLAPQPVLLAVSELAVRYAGRPVVEGVSLHVHVGECLALVGESGSGKSSVSRALVGLAQEACGQLRFAGEPLSLAVGGRSAEQRRRIQYIFQNPLRALNPRHTVAQSLATPLRHFFGLKGAALRQRIEQALIRVALPVSLADTYPGSLSGGERQRVAIARALVCEPRLLICDEITSALDVSVQASILALLRGLQDEGMALLFVTHDLNVVRAVADRVLVLKDGRLVEQGAVTEVFEQLRAAYTRQLLEHSL